MLRPMDLPTSGLYLDAVWSLLLLEKLTNELASIVLSSEFIEKLRIEDGKFISPGYGQIKAQKGVKGCSFQKQNRVHGPGRCRKE